jgi:hypothetical protein
LKKDGIANLLRRKCSGLELNIYRLTAGAGILLRTSWNHGVEADDRSKQTSRQFLHGRCFESTE